MKVPLLDLQAQYPTLRADLHAAVDNLFESQQFILGSEVQALEDDIAQYSKTKHAIGCASGSDALLLALMALGVKADDEVITTPFTFFATAGSIARLGARPVFVDIEPRTYNIDPGKIEAAISPRTRAIMPVHLYGQCAEMDRVIEISGGQGIPIIEDAAQAIGAEDKGRRAGSLGTIGCFSFYPSKNLGGAGDGGMLVTNDDTLAVRLRVLRVHGSKNEYQHLEVGINSRLDALQAAVLRVKLPHLDGWSNARRQKAAIYDQLLADSRLPFKVITPFVRDDARHIFHQYVVRVPRHRDALMAHLVRSGIGTKTYYPVPLHFQECFRCLGYKRGDFPESEAAASETLALPCYPELTDEQQRYVVDSFLSFQPQA
jgi:dTDP-4-amino-4,6-dideoxygalactose transaminase